MAKVDYLRLSVTGDCNLNCLYCRPRTEASFHTSPLSYKEMVEIVKVLAGNGIRKLRITGGEPLLREDIADLIGMLSGIRELEDISMTTNGVFLKKAARSLKEEGLSRINISLDTLRKDRYKDITGEDCLTKVFQGIEEALRAGLLPVKLNVVVMKGINEDEVLDFVKLACHKKIIIRFIELFSTNKAYHFMKYFVPNSSIKEKIEMAFGPLEEVGPVRNGISNGVNGIKGSGPARYFKVNPLPLRRWDRVGVIGFIDSATSDFCHNCSRIRMSCDGRLYQCLFSSQFLPVQDLLRSPVESLQRFIAEKKLYTKDTIKRESFEMSMRGG